MMRAVREENSHWRGQRRVIVRVSERSEVDGEGRRWIQSQWIG